MNEDWMMFRGIHECSRACPSVSREEWGMVSKPASPHASTIKPLQPPASSERWCFEEESVNNGVLFLAREQVMRRCQGTGRRERCKALHRV